MTALTVINRESLLQSQTDIKKTQTHMSIHVQALSDTIIETLCNCHINTIIKA